jgi:hypothetical protein
MLKKYYVTSGDLKVTILASNPMDACVKALQKVKEKIPSLGMIFGVSQKSFEINNYDDDDVFVFAPEVVKQAKLEHIYNLNIDYKNLYEQLEDQMETDDQE